MGRRFIHWFTNVHISLSNLLITVPKSAGQARRRAAAFCAMTALGLATAGCPFLCFRFFWASKRNERAYGGGSRGKVVCWVVLKEILPACLPGGKPMLRAN